MAKQKIIQQGAEAIIYKKDDRIIKDRIKKPYRIPELDTKIRRRRTKAETKLLTKASKIINCPIPITEKSAASQIDILINNKKCVNKVNLFRGGGRGCGGLQNEKLQIIMPFIKGKKLSEHLDNFQLKKQKQILRQIGKDVAKLHNANIIHGDLTTSNMILVENSPARLHSQIDKKIDDNKKEIVKNRLIGKRVAAGEVADKSKPTIFFIDFGLGFISHKFEDKAVDLHLLKQALEARHFKNWKDLFTEFEKGYKSANKKEAEKVFNQLIKIEKRGRYKS